MNNICICTWQQAVAATNTKQILLMNTGKYLDGLWIIRVEHIRMTHGCQARRHIPSWAASSRKENAELDTSGNITHRVKQAYYYWRYTKLELADSTIISPRLWQRLTLSLSIPPRLSSSHGLLLLSQPLGGTLLMLKPRPVDVFSLRWCRDVSDMAEEQRRQSAHTSSQVGAGDLTLMRHVFGSKGLGLTCVSLHLHLDIMLCTLQCSGLKGF